MSRPKRESSEDAGDLCRRGQQRVAAMLSGEDAVLRSARHVRTTESTNTLAMDEWRQSEGLADDASPRSGAAVQADMLPRLIVADIQSAGRGRQGNRWHSDEGTLTFSLIQRVTGDASMLPLAVGVGLARAIEFEFAPMKLQLKWPNDLIVSGSKLGGILCESMQSRSLDATLVRCFVIGVGLNVSTAPTLPGDSVSPHDSALPHGAAFPSISLSQHVGRPLHRYDVLPGLAQGILDAVDQASSEPHAVLDDFRSRCCLTGQVVQFDSGDRIHHGDCLGLDATGAMRVCVDGDERLLRSGDVRRVRTH